MISNELLGEVEGQIEGELEGYLEAVRKAKYPNAVIPPDVKDVALAVGRQSSRATAKLVKERTVGVETKWQTFIVSRDLTLGINSNVIYSLDITPDASYDLVTGMCVVVVTPDPAPTPGTVFTPFIGLQNDQTIVKDVSPRQLYIIDAAGTTPVSDRFTRIELDLKLTTGRNLKILSQFVTAPTFPLAVPPTPGQFYNFAVTLELSRAKRKVR